MRGSDVIKGIFVTFPSQIRSDPRTPEISSYGVNLKDGKRDGLVMFWCRNGRNQHEATDKDGELVHKYWSSKGEEVETLEHSEE
jgi:hypothetical protein